MMRNNYDKKNRQFKPNSLYHEIPLAGNNFVTSALSRPEFKGIDKEHIAAVHAALKGFNQVSSREEIIEAIQNSTPFSSGALNKNHLNVFLNFLGVRKVS